MATHRSGKRLIHVVHTVRVRRPFDALSGTLASASDWMPRAVGVRIAGVPVRKRVSMRIGDAVLTSTWAAVSLSWTATFPRRLFPNMEGKVALSPAGLNETKLAVSGMYEPPLGRVGENLNSAVLHSVAEMTVKELAESIAARLEKRTSPD